MKPPGFKSVVMWRLHFETPSSQKCCHVSVTFFFFPVARQHGEDAVAQDVGTWKFLPFFRDWGIFLKKSRY